MDINSALNETDLSATLSLNGSDSLFWDGAVHLYTTIYIWIPTALALLFLVIRNTRREQLLLVLLMIGLTILLCDQLSSSVFKPLFERFRPTRDFDVMHLMDTVNGYRGGKYGFFSGHAANSFGIATFVALLVRNKHLTISLLIWATLNILTRTYLGVHYVGDVLTGTLVGVLIAFMVFGLYKTITKRGYRYSHRESELYTSSGYLRKDIAAFMVVLYSTYLLILFIALIMQGIKPM
ncbi:MAG: phosphatase PAP2 family protein [Bacteroidaceae bacterium]|nr:phosphatase PAP2 family protein [Bacteroidaceae bacterium]